MLLSLVRKKREESRRSVFVEFPEFLGVLVSNSLKAFAEPGIRMLGRAFFDGNEDSYLQRNGRSIREPVLPGQITPS